MAAQRDELRSQLKATRRDLTLAKAARQDAESSAAAKGQRLGQLQAIVDDAFARQIESLTSENQSPSGRVGWVEHDNVSVAAGQWRDPDKARTRRRRWGRALGGGDGLRKPPCGRARRARD